MEEREYRRGRKVFNIGLSMLLGILAGEATSYVFHIISLVLSLLGSPGSSTRLLIVLFTNAIPLWSVAILLLRQKNGVWWALAFTGGFLHPWISTLQSNFTPAIFGISVKEWHYLYR